MTLIGMPPTGEDPTDASRSGTTPVDPAIERRLEQRWEDRPGLIGFLTTVDHKKVGKRYIVTAFVFFFLAGLQALAMRTQLAAPEQNVLGPSSFNELFTMHGTTMIFLFNTPVLAGMLLVAGGVAAVSAASPDPSAAPGTTTTPSGKPSHNGVNCPNMGTNGSGGGSSSNGSSAPAATPAT